MSTLTWYGDNEGELLSEVGKKQVLIARAGYDDYVIFGDAYKISSGFYGGNDIIMSKAGQVSNNFYGDVFELRDSYGGDDKIFGGGNFSSNLLYGDAHYLSSSSGGNDLIKGGGAGSMNQLLGDALTMDKFGEELSRGGDDILKGGAENSFNYIYGDARYVNETLCGNDILIAGGQYSFNYLFGDSESGGVARGGDDRLESGEGKDYLYGDFFVINENLVRGSDIFVFYANNGTDVIKDFVIGQDKIELSGISGFANFSDLEIAEIDGSSEIRFSADDAIIVASVVGLQAGDFIFS